MPFPPYAILRASVNSAPPATGGLTVPGSATIQLSADPTGAAGAYAYKYEIYDYPATFTQPSGWSTDSNGVYFYNLGQTPPVFTLPTNATWGKFMLRLTLNNGVSTNTHSVPASQLVDEDTALDLLSPSGLHDFGFNETGQWSSAEQWVFHLKKNLRTIEAAISGGGGGGFSPGGTPTPGFVVTADSGGSPVWEPSGGLAVLSFVCSTPLVETSQTVTTPAFTASYNATPTSATLTNNANAESLDVHLTPTSFSSSQNYQKTTPNQTVTFTLTTSNGTRTTLITWGQLNYWGVSSSPANTSTFIQSLASSVLATARGESFTVNASGSNKIYFSCPTRYGVPIFSVGGFTGGFIQRATGISVTNAHGFSENYDLYESVSAGLGSTSVVVS